MTTGNLLDAHVRGYAQAVRLHLADLGPEVVDDLTDGLEADLAEALTDREPVLPAAQAGGDDVVLDLTRAFGPADRYAAELRSAAGLPPAAPAAPAPGGGARAGLAAARAGARDAWARAWSPVTSTPAWRSARALAGELRPVWWVARGWVLGSWAASAVGGSWFSLVPVESSDLVLQAAAVVVSVQWGRGRWLPWRWAPRLAVVATVAAAFVVVPLADVTRDRVVAGSGSSYDQGYADAMSSVSPVSYGGVGVPDEDGVWVDGMQVSNLFAYDAEGDPIKDVQLFDDRGRPVRTVSDEGATRVWAVPDVEGRWYFQPGLATDGRQRWNAYPLSAVAQDDMVTDDATGTLRPAVGTQPRTMPWPFLKAPTAIAPAGAAGAGEGAGGDEDRGPDTPGGRPGDRGEQAPSRAPEPARAPGGGAAQEQATAAAASR
jgi:hypothetical protein